MLREGRHNSPQCRVEVVYRKIFRRDSKPFAWEGKALLQLLVYAVQDLWELQLDLELQVGSNRQDRLSRPRHLVLEEYQPLSICRRLYQDHHLKQPILLLRFQALLVQLDKNCPWRRKEVCL